MKLRNEHKVIHLEDPAKIQEHKALGYVEVPAKGKAKEVKADPGQGEGQPKSKPFKGQNVTEQTATINACATLEALKELEADVKPTAKPAFDAKVKELEDAKENEGQGEEPVPFKELSDEEQVKVVEECEKLEDLDALIAQEPKELAQKAIDAKITELQA